MFEETYLIEHETSCCRIWKAGGVLEWRCEDVWKKQRSGEDSAVIFLTLRPHLTKSNINNHSGFTNTAFDDIDPILTANACI